MFYFSSFGKKVHNQYMKPHEFINITVQDEAEADGTLEAYGSQYLWIAGANR